MSKRDTPDEETNDWRAVCGRTARTVRRAGRAQTLPDPYRLENPADLITASFRGGDDVGSARFDYILFRRDGDGCHGVLA